VDQFVKETTLGRLLVRRFLLMILVLFGISILTFLLSRVVPADPARMIAGPRASAQGVAQVRKEYGLDLPLFQQYIRYVTGLVHLDFGISFSSRRPVATDLIEFLPATAELALSALLIAILGGITVGVVSAVRQNSLTDRVSRLFAITGLSLPGFWLALLAQLFLYQRLGWLPFGGRISDEAVLPHTVTGFLIIDSLIAGQWATLGDALYHLILPALVLALEPLAVLARIMRTSMLEVMREQYVTTARAKGLRENVVVVRHALKNAMLPVVTMIGLQVGYMLGGSVLIESVFAWPGIGRYSARAIISADYNAVMGVTLVIAAIYLVTNVVVDLAYSWLDPRIRY
jgi:peptide/nickel transport system permease protein